MTERVSDCGAYHEDDLAVQFHGFPSSRQLKVRSFDHVLAPALVTVIVVSSVVLISGLGQLLA